MGHLLLGETVSHRNRLVVTTAEAHYAASTALALELGMRPLVAHCGFSIGKLYRRAGDRRARGGPRRGQPCILTGWMGVLPSTAVRFSSNNQLDSICDRDRDRGHAVAVFQKL